MTATYRFALLAAIAACAPTVMAAPLPFAHQLVPAHPTTQDIVQLKTHVSGCIPPADVTVDVDSAAGVIDVEYRTPAVACDPAIPSHTQSPRFAPIGRLPAGTYTARVTDCQAFPGGANCFLYDELFITVSAAIIPHAIPALSWLALMGMVALIVAFSRKRVP